MEYWWARRDSDFVETAAIVVDSGEFWAMEDFYEPENFVNGNLTFDPLQMDLVWANPKPNIPDFISFDLMFGCREETLKLFSEGNENQVRRHEIVVSGERLLLLCPTITLDILDFKNCNYETSVTGTKYRFTKFAFTHIPAENLNLFGITDPKHLQSHYFVSDKFKRIYEKHSLTGIRFVRVQIG